MAKRRPPPGKCVHCLSDPVPRTWDHVFPESWYPDTTLRNIEKWEIPACQLCNREYGKSEIIGQLLKGSDIPETAIYPNFEEKWGRPPEQQKGILIPANSVHRLFEKIVRGVFYLEDRKFIEPPYLMNLYPPQDRLSTEFTSLLERFGQFYAREPGIVVQRAVAREDGMSSILKIEIWKAITMYAMATGPESIPVLVG